MPWKWQDQPERFQFPPLREGRPRAALAGTWTCGFQFPPLREGRLPEALRFDYLIFDGKYCYMEQYRRGDFEPIHGTIKAFLEYLDGAELMETYQKNWEV